MAQINNTIQCRKHDCPEKDDCLRYHIGPTAAGYNNDMHYPPGGECQNKIPMQKGSDATYSHLNPRGGYLIWDAILKVWIVGRWNEFRQKFEIPYTDHAYLPETSIYRDLPEAPQMNIREKHQLLAEKTSLDRMLASLPESSVIDRMSLEARKAKVEKDLIDRETDSRERLS